MNEAPNKPGTPKPPEASPGRFFLAGRWWVVGLVAAVLAGQWLYTHARRPRHLDVIATECGNISYMLENEKPCLNHAENRLLFCHSTEKGMGVFLCDIGDGSVSQPKKLIFEEPEIRFGMGPHGVLKVFPWSPDDRFFIYARQGPGAENGENDVENETILSVGNAATGKEAASINVPLGQVTALDWLDNNSFVYVTGRERQDFYLVENSGDSLWTQTKLNRPEGRLQFEHDETCSFSTKRSPSFAAVSSNTIAWLQANAVWTLNVFTKQAEKLMELPQGNGSVFTSFDYSKANRVFLLRSIEGNVDSLWRMSLDDSPGLTHLFSATRPRNNTSPFTDAMWLGSGEGVVCRQCKGGNDFALVVRTSPQSPPAYLFDNTKIEYFLPIAAGGKILVVGDMDYQPGSGIWLYDLESHSNRCLVSARETPLQQFRHIHGTYGRLRVAENKIALNVLVFPPVNFDRKNPGKQHPVVIMSNRYVAMEPFLSQYGEAVANAGGYFILIDHPWSQTKLSQWEYYMENVASSVAGWPGVDPCRVFMISNSAQGLGLLHLMAGKPGTCRGAIMFVPPMGSFFKPEEITAKGCPPKLLVTTETHASQSTLAKCQSDAAGVGLRMDYIIHPGTPHEFIAKQSQRDRIKAMLDFIFED